MPVPNFLASFADKAQSAINASPLAGHIPASLQQNRPTSPDAANQPSANQAAAHGGAKSHTLETLQHQFRSLQQQYGNTNPVQRIITTEKGVAIDFESVALNSKSQSKELYTWGQSEPQDLKDVTDRIAYLNFVQGSLASSLSSKLDSARGPLKALRDAETNLQPRRNIRAGIQNQIGRLEHEQHKGKDKQIADLREQLRKAEFDDHQLELEVELLKRKAVRESEQLKWDAIREYGEKLVLLSQAASPIIAVLPSVPPTPTAPYTGAQTTGAVRASLQRALDNYKTGHINLPPQLAGADLSRSDTRSFGESHASELSSLHSSASPTQATTPPSSFNKPLPSGPAPGQSTLSPFPAPINPQALNNSPAPIPTASPSSTASPHTAEASSPVPVPALPTVAETGVPVSAGPNGPGPASGSLHDIKGASSSAGPRTGGLSSNEITAAPAYGQGPTVVAPVPRHETAEEEKKRLAAAYSHQQYAPPAGPPSQSGPSSNAPSQTTQYESAEDEKKRLEREERERILRSGGNFPQNDPPKDNKDDELPPYQEPGLH
ncbi:Eisosome component PIL1-domain-containing protein [Gymnopilus junonius]|uniref:Eisosome component PIL1-domain-containing protein n=1 Tax=Gymnopilus junonius TaxID=109634 RepID=A0A9P5NZY3_GYMJU|nr:Eisosome component PIL1-domain-containing protein [Gymnopilus junonius]